ncbi:hypothetical protein SEPCBS119000_005814 [Sporothrix epigloea]|uniref:BHLH domain-containing protein n=1 Tax=Sporothrix epigloea TaxID=1892477 RepID=A0ABP0DZY0_9PEZI
MFPLLASEAVAGATGVASDAGNAGDARGNDASLPNMLSYLPYGEVQQRGLQAEEYPSSFEQSFVAPQNNQQQTPYVYDWNAQGIQTAGLGLASVYPEAGQDDKTTSPVETESGTFTPSSIRSTSSAGQFSSLYTGTANIDYQLAATAANETLFAPSSSAGKGLSAAKRGKAKQKPKPSGNSSGKGKLKRASPAIKSSSSGESSLSGAGPSSSHENQPSSRAVAPANAKSVEKRRGKSKSHNLVETQYRERLTEQFDRLRSALPQPSESLQASGSGTGSGVEPRAVAAAEERRTSKAEVLEMARNHIQDLEQRRDDLVRQKVELESTSQRLRQIYASHSLGQGQTGGPQPMFDDDEEEQEEQGENIG